MFADFFYFKSNHFVFKWKNFDLKWRFILTNSTYQNKEGVGAAIKTALNGGLKCEIFLSRQSFGQRI